MNLDLFRYTLNNIRQRKIRSWLIVISIVIGIMAIFALASFGLGLKSYLSDTFAKMGTDKLIIQPRSIGAPGTGSINILDSDVQYMSRFNGIKQIEKAITKNTEIKYDLDKKGKFEYVMGLDPSDALIRTMMDVTIVEGSDLKKNDKYKAVLGNNYLIPNKVYEKPLKRGDKIYITGIPFEVVGFYSSVGNPADDANVYITLSTAEEIFNLTGKYQAVYAQAQPGVNVTDLANSLETKLAKNRGEKKGEETLHVQTFQQLFETFNVIINVLNAILLLIALISVIVAGVNIMNSMYTAVLERTKEIGIMKAIGAKRGSILSIFITEAASLGFVGGTMGVIVGFGVAKLGEAIAIGYGLSMLRPGFPLWLTLGCIGFATGVAAIAGLFPAIRAAKQNPVDALRYE